MKKGDGGHNALPRPRILVAIVIGSLYLVEVVIMNFFHEFAETAHGTMDALILSAVLLPLLYFLIYRPFSRSVNDLKALSGTLERQVRERTMELEFSEALHRAVITSSVDAIVRINGDGAILTANPAAHRMFGYVKTELENKKISLLLPDGHEKVLVEGFAASLDGWDGHSAAPAAEAVAVTRSGKKLTVECTSSECLVNNEISFVIIMRDVTGRKKAEDALRESKARYRLISEASFEGIVINIEGKVVDCNSAFARMFGYTPDEIIGKIPVDLSPPESHAIIMDHIRRESEEVYDVVARKKDGTLFNIEMRGRSIMYQGVKARITAMRDITGRVKAERAIRESEERYRQLSDSAFEGIGVSENGIVITCNRALASIFGYELSEVKGLKVMDITAPECREIVLQRLASGDDRPYEITMIKKDGTRFPVEVHGTNATWNGRPVRITAVRDLTRQKRAEDALRKSEERYRGFFENTSNAVVVFDAETLRYEDANSASLKLFGYTKEELLSLTPRDISAEAEKTDAAVNAVIEGKSIQVPLRYLKKKDGSVFPATIYSGVFYENDRKKIIGAITDLSEQKKAETELKAAKEAAEEATKLKDKFIAMVSHDLKTPLASMIGFLKLVRHDHGEPLSDGAKLILDRAAESGDAMVHLIDDLLTISRFETGQLKLNRQFFDAEYLGAMMAANYAGVAAQKGIELENIIPANYRIYGDKTLLTEAVQNLVTNAIKFCKSGDRITIAAVRGDAPVICVRDTGPGIKPNILGDLFRFEKKTSTTGTAGETGTGFGLPLVKSIMDLHGGGLKVDSEPGKGSLFSLSLPYVRPKILLVDDDTHSRYLQMHRLRELNADILEAENGKDALDMIASIRPNLVITDIKMAVMDGIELLKRIKGTPDTKDIPVIVVSGEYGMEIRDTVFKFGGDDFVTKNRIDMEDFFPRIRRFIG